ncbi:MAG TPA: hypothetical protein PLF16_02770, partial [Candidatus Staskawiczbacteria bacterium]|nr:hypothetical protein [Candidatus Staskawiczbacteria bacterium]
MDINGLSEKLSGNLFGPKPGKVKSIAIKTNFLCSKKYPFSGSWDLFEIIIKEIRKKYHGQMF